MFNLEQIAKHLQDPSVTMQDLIRYVQNPTGQVPSVLALAELKRRQQAENARNIPQAGGLPTIAQKTVAEATPRAMGISELPLPDHMYDEKSMGAGGIVAFNDGGETSLNLDRLASLNLNTGAQSMGGSSSGMQDYTICKWLLKRCAVVM